MKRSTVRTIVAVGSLAVAALWLAACGGGTTPAAPATSAPATSAPATAAPAAKATAAVAAPPKAAATAAPAAAPTAAAAPYYGGKTITFVVGSSAGGAYDIYTRTVARHIGKHIPGNPRTVVENRDGGGGLAGANHVFGVAKPDGLTIGNFVSSISFLQVLGADGVQYDAAKFNWLGSVNQDVIVPTIRADSGITKLEDTIGSNKEVLVASSAGASVGTYFPNALNGLLGTHFKVVSGYKGNDAILAIERGEVQGRFWSLASVKTNRPEWVKPGNGVVNIVVQMAVAGHPSLPTVPVIGSFAKSEDDRRVIELLVGQLAFGKSFAAPPGVSAENVKILRDALSKTVTDPEFLEEAKKLKLDLDNPIKGEELQGLAVRMLSSTPALVEKVKKIVD